MGVVKAELFSWLWLSIVTGVDDEMIRPISVDLLSVAYVLENQ